MEENYIPRLRDGLVNPWLIIFFRLIGEGKGWKVQRVQLQSHNALSGSKRTFLRVHERTIYRVDFCDTKLYRLKYNLYLCFT